ncbi:MAG: hypothetical protein WC613_04355 [Candidatus Aenigmatarchaeota archaeon]
MDAIAEKALADGSRLVLGKSLLDEWASRALMRQAGSAEYYLILDTGYSSSTANPSASWFLDSDVYHSLFSEIKDRATFDVVDFGLALVRDETTAAHFLKRANRLAEIKTPLEYAYFDFVDTFRQVTSVDQLPKISDLFGLLQFAEANALTGTNLNSALFGVDYLLARTRDISLFGTPMSGKEDEVMNKHKIYHFFNHEFVAALANEINALGIDGPVVEIAASSGKLSYWLRKHGIHVHPTDFYPREHCEGLECSAALEKYKPAVVVSSWLEPGSEQQRKILSAPYVKAYFSIESEGCGYIVDRTGHCETGFLTRPLPAVERYSIPIDFGILYPTEQRIGVLRDVIQEKRSAPSNTVYCFTRL